MADNKYDPNVYVPVWVNVGVPIVTGLIFLAVIVLLFFTNKEIPIEHLEKWAEHVPLLNKYLTTTESDNTDNNIIEGMPRDARNTDTRRTTGQSQRPTSFSERPRIDMLRYDSIFSIETHGTNATVSGDSDLKEELNRPYFYASQGTLLHFETNV